MAIDLIDRQQSVAISADEFSALEHAVETALSLFELEGPFICVSVVDDGEIHALNKRFRGMDNPTDVLSFAAREGERLVSTRRGEYLGDIIISAETAARQADEYGHGFARELAFLAVHGTLHLLGYDHMDPDDEREMFALQHGIMEKAGLPR